MAGLRKHPQTFSNTQGLRPSYCLKSIAALMFFQHFLATGNAFIYLNI